MPRPPRLHVPGGFYHVVLRGNHREALFGTAADRGVLMRLSPMQPSDHAAHRHALRPPPA